RSDEDSYVGTENRRARSPEVRVANFRPRPSAEFEGMAGQQYKNRNRNTLPRYGRPAHGKRSCPGPSLLDCGNHEGTSLEVLARAGVVSPIELYGEIEPLWLMSEFFDLALCCIAEGYGQSG